MEITYRIKKKDCEYGSTYQRIMFEDGFVVITSGDLSKKEMDVLISIHGERIPLTLN